MKVKVEVAVLGSPSLIVLWSLWTWSNIWRRLQVRAQELCVKVEVAVLGSPSLTVFMVSVDVKQHWKRKNVCVYYNYVTAYWRCRQTPQRSAVPCAHIPSTSVASTKSKGTAHTMMPTIPMATAVWRLSSTLLWRRQLAEMLCLFTVNVLTRATRSSCCCCVYAKESTSQWRGRMDNGSLNILSAFKIQRVSGHVTGWTMDQSTTVCVEESTNHCAVYDKESTSRVHFRWLAMDNGSLYCLRQRINESLTWLDGKWITMLSTTKD